MKKCYKCRACFRSKHRTDDEKKYLKTRLNTIEGQVRGVSRMIDEDKYCNDILIQLLAINKSIKSISIDILKGHLSTCVAESIKNDKLDVIDDVTDLIGRLT